MNDPVQPLTPKAKLALSRAELLAAMGYAQVNGAHEVPVLEQVAASPGRGEGALLGSRVVGRWWSRHPASAAFELLEPGLARYARRNPGRLVAYAAATGAALVVLRPWRLLSFGAVLALIIRSTDIAGAVSAATRALAAPHGVSDPLERPPLDTARFEGGSTWSEARHTADGS